MPLEFEQFVKNPKLCPALVLPDEDQPQDVRDWKKKESEYQRRCYKKYMAQFETQENKEVTLQPTSLRNNVQSRAEYMREYRKKPVTCPSCGHQFRSLKRV